MQIADFFRASILNSSDSAFRLALHSDENINFARKVISAKNESAHVKLTTLKAKEVNFHYTLMKTKKYDAFLMMINYIEMRRSAADILNNTNGNAWEFHDH